MTEPETHSLPRQFFEELKRRRVIRVATLYVLALWPIIQIVDILSPALALPPIAMRYLLVVFIAGLPLALILSWLYDLNRGGLVRTSETAPSESVQRSGHPLVSRSAEITVVSVLIIAVAILFMLQSSLDFEDVETPVLETAAETGFSSIAVLPFISFSESREDELFADGLTEELLNVISQIRSLRVIARTTSFAYKGVSRNVQEIGKELNVDTILEGSVRRNDVENTIRVTAQLIDSRTGGHLWSDTYDREFRDIFKIQDEIAAAVAGKLDRVLGEEETRRLQSRSTANPEAMVAYGMGRAALGRRTSQSLKDAERYFQRAIEMDGGYTDAIAELANAYSLQADLEPERREALLQMAQDQVDRALDLDDDSGATWAAQGLIYMIRAATDPDAVERARQALGKAIEINPNLAMANMWYGNMMEDPAEQQRYHAIAFELDPRSPVAGYNLASDLIRAGRESAAMDIFSRIVDADPNYPGAYLLIAELNEFRGRLGEAIHNYEKVYDLQPTSQISEKLATLWIDIGDFERAEQWMRRAEDNAPPEMADGLAWMRISAAVAVGNRPAADALMAKLLESKSNDPKALMNAARASYFMEDYASAVEIFEQLEALDLPEPIMEARVDILESQTAMAFAYQQLGRTEDALTLANQTEAQIRQIIDTQPRVHPNYWFTLAQLNAIRGDNSLALIHLQRAVDEGWRQHWRPMVEPSMAELVKESAFSAMMQGLTTRMDLIREQIAFDKSFEQNWQT